MTAELREVAREVTQFIHACATGESNEELFNRLALQIFALQYRENSAYGRYCRQLNATPERIGYWEQIPPIVTTAFKELELSVLPKQERTHVFHSSGTTEQKPSRHFHNEVTMGVYEQSLLGSFGSALMEGKTKGRFLFLTPSPQEAPHSSLVHMFGVVGRELGSDYRFASEVDEVGGWVLRLEAAREFLKDHQEPVIVCGTAFSFVHLFDGLRGEQLELPRGSKVLETGGYKGRSREVTKAELRRMICDLFVIQREQIISEYGMSELSSQAYDLVTKGKGGGAFSFSPWARARVISPETGREVADGETGLVRVYDMANIGSVIAIQTEDLGIRRGGGFELVGRATASEARGCSLMAA